MYTYRYLLLLYSFASFICYRSLVCLQERLLGKRIVDIQHLLDQLRILDSHDLKYNCSFRNLNLIQEKRFGLSSKLHFKCNMCLNEFYVELNKPKNSEMDINTSVVAGAVSIGIGYSNAQELFEAIDIPFLSSRTYAKYHDIVHKGWEQAALLSMKEAGREEAEHAVAQGQVDEDGIPVIKVVADGCWSKRSYKKNYNALSGVAAIVGQTFGKVLFIGVRNKYCTLCTRYQAKEVEPPSHHCFKNFSGSSTSMEADILVEGFRTSVEMHNLKYKAVIADGDSSTYKRILEARPYSNVTVEKIECRNHLLRNFCNKLHNIVSNCTYPLKLRKILEGNIGRMRSAVVGSIAYNKSQNNGAEQLQKDLQNTINHVFGVHDECLEYYCKRKNLQETNNLELIKTCPDMFHKIISIMHSLELNVRSLIQDVDSNVVEHFNSTVAKFVGGKRINFSLRGSYSARCSAAVASFNTKRPHYTLHKTLCKRSPKDRINNLEIVRQRKIRNAAVKRLGTQTVQRKLYCKAKNGNKDYGEFCERPDMDTKLYEQEKERFFNNLVKNADERKALERSTVLQAGSGEWLEYRRKLLTASNFYSVCTRRATTSCANLVKKLLYGGEIKSKSIIHGRENESRAIAQLEKQEQVTIQKCGLFIHESYAFLGATPDGVIDNNRIVEIKCPFSAVNMAPDEAVKQKKIKFWKFDSTTSKFILNKKHCWYYQIQGQLQVSNRTQCLFGVWTSSDYHLKVECVERDDNFWTEKMLPKLTKFYNDCLLPELIDSRMMRNMAIRDDWFLIH